MGRNYDDAPRALRRLVRLVLRLSVANKKLVVKIRSSHEGASSDRKPEERESEAEKFFILASKASMAPPPPTLGPNTATTG